MLKQPLQRPFCAVSSQLCFIAVFHFISCAPPRCWLPLLSMSTTNPTPAALVVRDLAVCINETTIVHKVNFELAPGDIGCLLGPSGCGKTTILRAIAGFEQPCGGEILLGEQCLASEHNSIPTEHRGVGMVFQDLALFPHLKIEDNIGFGLSHWPRAKRRARVEQLLNLIDLRDAGKRYPHELSGGQQQRVALARAVAPKPALLLLDEPFSGQDAERREVLAREVRTLLKHEGITGLLVTHDQLEAFAIADHVGVVQAGEIRQWDTAYNVYHEPADRFVASFVGEGVLVCGSVMGSHELMTELGEIRGDLNTDLPLGTEVDLLVRPDDVVHDDHSDYVGVVTSRKFRGSEHLYTIRLPGSTRVLCAAPSHHDHQVGESIGVQLRLDHMVIFERETTLSFDEDRRRQERRL